jgi:subtilase family serine protease
LNKLEQLAASVSAVALLSSAASAAVTLPGGPRVLTQEEIAQLPEQRDMNRQREFIVLLKAEEAGAADAVEAYFHGFGFATEYWSELNAIKLLGNYSQAERAGNFRYVAGRVPITPLRVSKQPTFPAAVQNAILSTSFNPGPLMQPMVITPSNPTTIPNTNNVVGLAPKDYARIYGYNNLYSLGLRGQGQTVDIAACFGFNSSFLASYQSTFGLQPAPSVTAVTSQHGSSIEANLAVQRVYSTAPAAKIRIWLASSCNLGSFVASFFEIATDQKLHPAAALTASFGLPELIVANRYSSLFTMIDSALAKITGPKQKVALFAPSGDYGDASFLDHQILGTPLGQTDVFFPASDRNVLSVGGTNLVLTSNGMRAEETAWGGTAQNCGGAPGFSAPCLGGSGGGISNTFPLPPWQKKIPGTFSQKFKNLPDVAHNASITSPTLMFFFQLTAVQGTSAASATWAGTVALLQQHFKGKMTDWPAFFYNPTQRAGLFTDITDGTNGFFKAGKGYDNVTGLGVPCFLQFPKPCKNGK